MQQKQLEINGQHIAYYESTGTGHPVLFVHGNSLSGSCFSRQLESSLGSRFRCIAIDLPGHGQSHPLCNPSQTCTLPGYAALISDFVQALAIEDALLVGWSLGGHILLEASAALSKTPGLVIFGTPPVGTPLATDAFLPNPLLQLLFKSSLNVEEATALVGSFFKSGYPIPHSFVADIVKTDGRARETLAISLAKGYYTDEVALVADFGKLLAMLHGEHENLINRCYLEQLSIPALWRRKLQIIPDAGHALHWEQPDQFNHLLFKIIAECAI